MSAVIVEARPEFRVNIFEELVTKSPREQLVEDARAKVISAVKEGNFDNWISLDTNPSGDSYFITRLMYNQASFLENNTLKPLISLLSEGVLPVKYFSRGAPVDVLGTQRREPQESPVNRFEAGLVTIEGRIDASRIHSATVYGPDFFSSRLVSDAQITIEDIQRIGICRPTKSSLEIPFRKLVDTLLTF